MSASAYEALLKKIKNESKSRFAQACSDISEKIREAVKLTGTTQKSFVGPFRSYVDGIYGGSHKYSNTDDRNIINAFSGLGRKGELDKYGWTAASFLAMINDLRPDKLHEFWEEYNDGQPLEPLNFLAIDTGDRQPADRKHADVQNQLIKDILNGNPVSPIAECFIEFLKDRVGADRHGHYWEFRAAAGSGKSVAMANILKAINKRHKTAFHFFINDGSGSDGPFQHLNSEKGFIEHLRFQISQHFPDVSGVTPEELTVESFLKLLFKLSDKGYIGAEKSLIIIIDAIDEATDFPLPSLRTTPPLGLPAMLPPGVIVAFSRRPLTASNLLPLRRTDDYTLIELVDPNSPRTRLTPKRRESQTKVWALHKCAARQYAVSQLKHKKKKELEALSNSFDKLSISDIEGVAEEICKRVRYRFLALRILLTSDYFSAASTLDLRQQNLEEVLYGWYVSQLTDGSALSFKARVLYSLSFDVPHVAREILEVMSGVSSVDERKEFQEVLEAFQSQGLVTEAFVSGTMCFRPFHFTLRQYLTRHRVALVNEFLAWEYLRSLMDAVDLGKPLEGSLAGGPEIQQQWSDIVLPLIVQLNAIGRLVVVLQSFEFWKSAAAFPGGLGHSVKKICFPSDIKLDIRLRTEQLFAENGRRLYNWIADGRLRNMHGKVITTSDLRQLTFYENQTQTSASPIPFARFIRAQS